MFYRAKFNPGDKFMYAIFGVQYIGDSPQDQQKELIEKFDQLIAGKAHLDRLVVPGANGLATQVWLSYWWPDGLAEWWSTPAVKEFWTNLPDHAGMYREFLTVSPGRAQNACTADNNNGVNGLGERELFSDKIGYWGCVRHRVADTAEGETFTSSLPNIPERVPESPEIRRGRTLITDLPDNICFLVEGQDHSLQSEDERAYWFEEFDELVTGWMTHLSKDTASNGLFDVRMGYVPQFGTFRDKGPAQLDHKRKIELFYWMDMSKFERAGRVHHGHIKLRKKWLESYGPGGKMGPGIGNICLWEETSILKGGEIDAEYVGCREGTGFMAYDKTEAVQSRQTAA